MIYYASGKEVFLFQDKLEIVINDEDYWEYLSK
jgi:hypothetical protein